MYSEVLESIQENILLTTKSLGLGSFVSYIKIIFNGYFPEFISIVLYRFESNIKNSPLKKNCPQKGNSFLWFDLCKKY